MQTVIQTLWSLQLKWLCQREEASAETMCFSCDFSCFHSHRKLSHWKKNRPKKYNLSSLSIHSLHIIILHIKVRLFKNSVRGRALNSSMHVSGVSAKQMLSVPFIRDCRMVLGAPQLLCVQGWVKTAESLWVFSIQIVLLSVGMQLQNKGQKNIAFDCERAWIRSVSWNVRLW